MGGHEFRNDLFKMVADMKPAFIRFPGGCFVEGEYLRNAFRWKETVGAWEERPGHLGDVWFYWTDDDLGHYEFFQAFVSGYAVTGDDARSGTNMGLQRESEQMLERGRKSVGSGDDARSGTNVNESSSSNKQPIQHPFVTISVFKRWKRHRRKHFENQEPCIMRGVYYKNMKWQAAIKVFKKQIHLGTVGSQQEAACLYDRAAFMCGREPNFELMAEEKDELSKLSWDGFLTMTRSAINSKSNLTCL
ncbi:putative non-reducing end alpha-L-arabinofuranosidase [Helianthus debilis subsp. tardiflorus]